MSRPSAIAAEQLITAEAVVQRPLLLLQDGRLAKVTSQENEPAPPGTLRLHGATLAPGFLDIHVHGAGGRDVMEGTPEAIATAARMLARHGTTEFLATIVTAPLDHTLRALDALAGAIEDEPANSAARPIGIHLEGPFLSHAKRGVHPADELQPPSTKLFERFHEAARGHIRLMTIAPELPGALDLITHVAEMGVRISFGHSNALAAETRAGTAAARNASEHAVSATHTFNAMRALDHREPGILGVVLDDQDLYAELICDGVHTTPEAVRLWFRSKGAQRGILITDGMAATGMPDGQYKLGELDVAVSQGVCLSGGVLAGSVLTMDRAIANVQSFTGIDLQTALLLATRNPAALIGAEQSGSLHEEAEANLCIFQPGGTFAGTILRGEYIER